MVGPRTAEGVDAGAYITDGQPQRRGLTIAQKSGDRMMSSYILVNLSTVGTQDDPADSLDFPAIALHSFCDSGTYAHPGQPAGRAGPSN